MRDFQIADYAIYAGAEPFRDGEKPMIHTLESGLDIVADGNGVSLYGYVGTKDVSCWLYESRTNLKKSVECAANEWIKELEGLKKHEQIILLNAVGIKFNG